jgi:flagellar hook protein FlgE
MANVFTTSMSGMQSYQTMLDVTANNIANAETNGFKSSRVDFADQFYSLVQPAVKTGSTTGGVNSSQVGNGAQVAGISVQFNQGPIQSTGRDLDLAITGNGFFTLRDTGGTNFYSRVGSFGFNGGAPRELVDLSTGYKVLNTAGGTISPVETMPAVATSSLTLSGNLPTTASVPLTASSLKSLFALKATDGSAVNDGTLLSATTLANGPQTAALPVNFFGTAPDGQPFSGQLNLPANATVKQLISAMNAAFVRPQGLGTEQIATATLDSGRIMVTGNVHGAQMSLFLGEQPPPTLSAPLPASLAEANTWQYGAAGDTFAWSRARFTPDSVETSMSLFTGEGTQHTVNGRWFNTSTVTTGTGLPTDHQRQWDLIADVPIGGALVPGQDALRGLTFAADGTQLTAPTGSLQTTWTVGGASTINFDTSALRGFQADAVIDSTDTTGATSGLLESMAFNEYGILVGNYSNNKTMAMSTPEHQIGISVFANNAGLLSDGQNLWSPTASSGDPTLLAAGTAATNFITAGALEGSNVDMTGQFTNLISAQRGFQANSKAFQTGDQMLTEALSLFR